MRKDFIPVIRKRFSAVIELSELYIIEKDEHYVCLVTKEEKFKTSRPILEYMSMIEDKDNFAICHKFFAMNMDHVRRMEDGMILFDNGETRYLGIHSFAKGRKAYNKYITQR